MASNKMYDAKENHNDPDMANPASSSENSTGRDHWLAIAKDAHSQSTQYFDANIRNDIEKNMAHFSGRHAPGSKYYNDSYKHRAKSFRPKTRSMERKKEAAAAVALFSTNDVVHISAERSADKSHQISAEINQEILQYRLSNTIKWFQTTIGAYQDTLVSGICISHQYWDYEEVELKEPSFDENGNSILDEEGNDAFNYRTEVLRDTPQIDLRPIENVRFSIASDWRDPVNTSPFLIDEIPMTIGEIKRMAEPSRTSKIPWFKLTDGELMNGVSSDSDPVRQAREGNREDSTDESYAYTDFTTVWVHRNIIKQDGRDWVYYTLGVTSRLSDPVPLEQEYPHLGFGERPYVIGFSNIEAHKNYPDSLVKMGAGAQQDANEVNNQRRDNVALVLNRRYIVKRGATIDYGSLQRNVPGGVTETDDPNSDIKIEAPQDVTASSYQEQDRINMDFDEVTGHFSSSSVGSNRQLNETVGGMNLLSSSSDDLTEYPLKIFVVTWVEQVLKQLVKLEQRHESDRALLALIGEKIDLWKRHGLDNITDAWIQGTMNLSVNVGFGATNPQQRIERLSMGIGTIAKFAPQKMVGLDTDEVVSEVMGALGYSSAERFFPKQDEKDTPQIQPEPLSDYDRAKLDQEYQIHQDKLKDGELGRAHQMDLAFMKQEEMLYKLAQEEKISMEKFDLEMQKLDNERTKLATERQNVVDEMNMKITQGIPGI